MNMELYEIYADIAKISDGLMERKIEFTYDALIGVMNSCHPAQQLDWILTKIDWDTPSPDICKVSEALEDLTEFNKCFNIKELQAPVKKLEKFLAENK